MNIPHLASKAATPLRRALAICFTLVLAVWTSLGAAHAQHVSRQDVAALKSLAESFLLAQAANFPGTASVTLKEPDPRLNLAACPAPEAWMPQGSKALGKTSVGIRCAQPAWRVLLPATVSVMTNYVASAAPLGQGQKLGANDLVLRQADLATLPAGVLTDPAQAQGRTLQMPLAAGMPVSRSHLKSQPVVQQGQPVRLVASGNGFSVSGEGRALTSGAEGDLVQARTASGQQVAGVAQADGVLSVRY
ncbi:MAG: flagellar basal body P-ring biosynthesis protein FlgA [Pseudomonadota bacterium]